MYADLDFAVSQIADGAFEFLDRDYIAEIAQVTKSMRVARTDLGEARDMLRLRKTSSVSHP